MDHLQYVLVGIRVCRVMNICLQSLYALAVVILHVGTDAGGVGFSLPVVVVQPGLYVCS